MKYFVSRHPGAIAWAKREGLGIDEFVAHFDPSVVQPGDVVMGSLPMHIAAAVCAMGAKFLALTINTPAELRGKELTADDMDKISCVLQEFYVEAR